MTRIFTSEKRKCLVCQKEYWVRQSRLKRGKGLYCSHFCSATHKYSDLKFRERFDKMNIGRNVGERNHNWISDRTKLVPTRGKDSPIYRKWSLDVKKRDNFKCRIGNKDCCGKLESHHILMWAYFPELRYDVNNGITLCHFHHPFKHSEVERLSPFFKELIGTNKINQ